MAAALGIELDADPAALIDEAAQTNFAHRPSMLQDVAPAGRPRSPRSTAASSPRPAPAGGRRRAMQAIVELISGLERSWAV